MTRSQFDETAKNLTPGHSAIVKVLDLKRQYNQGSEIIHAVDGVTFEIRKGEFTVLSGPSGSGKTTILNLIGALDEPTSGSIFLEGQDLHKMSRQRKSLIRRDRIGFVFQAYNLIPVLTAVENAEFTLMLQHMPVQDRRDRIRSLFEDLGLKGLENRKPHQMSGGQQQRVAIARAISTNPAIVLADEPTANVDSITAEKILDTMEYLNDSQTITFLFSSHDPRVIRRGHRIIRLKDGKIESDEIGCNSK